MKLGLVALAILSGLSTTLAHASQFSRVALLLPACELPGLGAAELRSALALDLRDEHLSLAPPGELSPSSDVLVSFETTCDGNSVLALRAEYRGERYTRTIDLGELPPPQRARALSLSLAELLSLFEHPPEPPAAAVPVPPPPVAQQEPAKPAKPAPPPEKKAAPPIAPAPSPPSDTPPARRSSARSWELAVAPELRYFTGTLLWGARALVRYRGFSAGGAILTCQTADPTGTVRTLTPHALLGYSFEAWRTETALFEIGPRLGAGRTFMNAEASSYGRAISAEDVYLDAAVGVRYAFRMAPRWHGALGGEVGYAGGPVAYADDHELVRTSGLFVAAYLAAALSL